MGISFTDWQASRNGVGVDVDGEYGAQCWDSWSDFATAVLDVPTRYTYTGAGGGGTHADGYACQVFHKFDSSGINQWFTPASAGAPAQPGDVAFWEYGSAFYPYSHVAVVVEDRGGSLYCVTQNPGANHYQELTKDGLLGYLRPDNQQPFSGGNAQPAPVAPAGTYVVQPGDSYWAIAEKVWGGDTATINANMYKLVELNGHKALFAGDTVLLEAPAPAPTPAPAPVVVVPPVTPEPVVKPTPKPKRKLSRKSGPAMSEPIATHKPQRPMSPKEWNALQADIKKNASSNGEDPNEASQYDLVSLGFWNYAGERVIKTFAMTFSGILGTTGAVVVTNPSSADLFGQIGWTYIIAASAVSALTSLGVALSSFKNIVTLPVKK